jgi:arylsulfatase A-like enzyme
LLTCNCNQSIFSILLTHILITTGHATCAPSRASLITGKYPTKIGYEFTPATQMGSFVLGRLMGNKELTGIYRSENRQLGTGNYAIPKAEIMMSSALKEGGYNNIYIGKW